MHATRHWITRALAALVLAGGLGCPAFHNRTRDVDRAPVVTTGAGATILYPGQSPPVYQGPHHPRESGIGSYGSPGAPGTPQPGATHIPQAGGETNGGQVVRRSAGSPAPGGGGAITMLGGASIEEERHQEVSEAPRYWKYMKLPFMVVAAPFAWAADQITPDPEPGPEVPRLETMPQAPPAPAPMDYETATLGRLEDELDRRAAAEASGSPPVPQPERAAQPSVPQPAGSAPSAATGNPFAAELAALRAADSAASPPPPAPQAGVAAAPVARAGTPAAPPTPRAAPAPVRPPRPDPSLATASGHVDRDGDGVTDQWIFRENGEIARELLDEDFDGRPDRTLHYDLASHQIRAIEEDANHDGLADTWTQVEGGAIVRRRADDDADGHVDTWSYYRDGELTRLERDANGDGFRDRVSHYEGGRLVREELDDDADGRADLVKHYDDAERIAKVEEDSNGDGQIDVISHYQEGRLTRRELLDASLLSPAPSLAEHE